MLRDETKHRITEQLESMPFEEARNHILLGELGYDFGSPSHDFCLSWLLHKESIMRDEREASILDIAKFAKKLTRRQLRYTIYASIIATIAAITAIHEKIVEIIKILLNILK